VSAGFRFLGEEVVHEGFAFRTVVARFETPTGEEFRRDVVRHRGAVGVVPLDGDDVILVRQYRAPVGREVLEIPAGVRDVEGEDPAETARRELIEEAGFEAGSIRFLTRYLTAAGFTDEELHLYVAEDLRPVERDAQGHEEEAMTVERMPLAEAVAAVRRGEIVDAKTVIALLLLGS
jgi:8-oxo-dGTP pyrophosphatase MutT (NUDIX family)